MSFKYTYKSHLKTMFHSVPKRLEEKRKILQGVDKVFKKLHSISNCLLNNQFSSKWRFLFIKVCQQFSGVLLYPSTLINSRKVLSLALMFLNKTRGHKAEFFSSLASLPSSLKLSVSKLFLLRAGRKISL